MVYFCEKHRQNQPCFVLQGIINKWFTWFKPLKTIRFFDNLSMKHYKIQNDTDKTCPEKLSVLLWKIPLKSTAHKVIWIETIFELFWTIFKSRIFVRFFFFFQTKPYLSRARNVNLKMRFSSEKIVSFPMWRNRKNLKTRYEMWCWSSLRTCQKPATKARYPIIGFREFDISPLCEDKVIPLII